MRLLALALFGLAACQSTGGYTGTGSPVGVTPGDGGNSIVRLDLAHMVPRDLSSVPDGGTCTWQSSLDSTCQADGLPPTGYVCSAGPPQDPDCRPLPSNTTIYCCP
jgi:hypothetical protein